jgi:hypothetical protein
MFGMNKINTKADTTTKPVDHFAELKAAVHRACSVAEDNGVSVVLIRDFFQGYHTQYVQRALYASDRANITRMHDSRGNLIDHHGAIARAQAIRAEQQRLASEREWQESVNRRAEEQRIRDEFIK